MTAYVKSAGLNGVTRSAVLDAVAECGRLGTEAFLRAHGYRPSLRYQIRHRGRSYPSKAILGVAAGLSSAEFFGGAEHTVRHLLRLGFQVREGRRVVTALGLLELARARAAEARKPFDLPVLPLELTNYFASGSNRVGEIRGMASVGQDVGVAAPEVLGRRPSELELHALAGTDVNVFCDSGAYTAFTKGRAISELDWRRILGLYDRLAVSLGPQAWLVAPDKIADQGETLRLLEVNRARIGDLAANGARVLVAVQKGALPQADFATRIDEVLAAVTWIPAFSCAARAGKAMTTAADLGAFLRARPSTRHVHLLALGPTNRGAPAYLEHARAAGCSVSLDANWISANVGNESDGSGGKSRRPVRRYTLAQRIAKAALSTTSEVATALRTAWRELALILSFGIASVLCTEGGEN